MLDREQTNAALQKFAKYVVTQAKANITRKNLKTSGELYNSLKYEFEDGKNSFFLNFYMEDYGVFQDLGVRGASGGAAAPNSPFRFGTGSGKKGGLTKAMKQWVRTKGIKFRDLETGQFMSYDNTAFLIARAIYQRGIYATGFFSKPFEAGFERLPDEVVEAYGIDLEDFLQYSLNNDKKK